MLWQWLYFMVPWWLWTIVAIGLLVLAWRLFKVPPKWLFPAAAILLALLGYNRAAQSGWKAKEERDLRDADKLIEKARKARVRANAIPVENRRDNDGFRRD